MVGLLLCWVQRKWGRATAPGGDRHATIGSEDQTSISGCRCPGLVRRLSLTPWFVPRVTLYKVGASLTRAGSHLWSNATEGCATGMNGLGNIQCRRHLVPRVPSPGTFLMVLWGLIATPLSRPKIYCSNLMQKAASMSTDTDIKRWDLPDVSQSSKFRI